MRRLVAVLGILAVLAAAGRAERFRVGDLGELSIVAAGDWKITAEDQGDRLEVTIAPKGKVNATAAVRIGLLPDLRYETKAKLREQVRQAGERLLEMAVEKKVVLQDYYRTSGYGCYCQITDPARVGKPPVPGDYTVMGAGMIRLAPGVIAAVTIVADDFLSPEYQQLLGAVEGMEFRPAAP